MPGANLPQFDSLAQGLGYASAPVPDNDACSLEGTDQNGVLGAPASMPAPLQGVSIATYAVDAPPNGAFLPSNLHDDNYLDPLTSPLTADSTDGSMVKR